MTYTLGEEALGEVLHDRFEYSVRSNPEERENALWLADKLQFSSTGSGPSHIRRGAHDSKLLAFTIAREVLAQAEQRADPIEWKAARLASEDGLSPAEGGEWLFPDLCERVRSRKAVIAAKNGWAAIGRARRNVKLTIASTPSVKDRGNTVAVS